MGRDKLQHTISIFLLGLHLYSNSSIIKANVDAFLKLSKKKIESEEFPDVDISFCYYWFLICFFHDIGYAHNNMINQNKIKMFDKTEIDDVRKEVVNILDDNPENNSIPTEIIKTWKRYLDFKQKHTNQTIQEDIDHGILAGAYFYYMLNKIYKQKKKYRNNDEFVDESDLFWSHKLLEFVHKPISWIIVAHNIWYKNKNYEDTIDYEDNLSDLIIDEPIVKLEKYPLYFLLCLVDSLDTVKFLQKKQETDIFSILNNTLFKVTKEDHIEIKFINNHQNYNCAYQKMIITLNKWLDLRFQIII